MANAIPFTFFVSLLRGIANSSGEAKPRADDKRNKDYPALGVFRRWVAELHRRYPEIPSGATEQIFRFLFCEEEKRRMYDIQEKRLVSYIGELFGSGPTDATLVGWDQPGGSGCLGNEVTVLMQQRSSADEDAESKLTLAEVDVLLEELASLSAFSHRSVRENYSIGKRRDRRTVLRQLYQDMIPADAGFLTQIILKDLTPMLYPLRPEFAHYSAALRQGKSTDIYVLSRYDALRIYDPSGRMKHAWTLTGIEGAANAFETKTGIWMPEIGRQLQVPKSQKGQSCKHALAAFPSKAETIWAETKYDGERCQIHVEICADGAGDITIFSKSGRDSTQDRHGIHDVIRKALGCGPSNSRRHVTQNVILDAEMVAFNDTVIEPFWRIRRLIEKTSHGARGQRRAVQSSDSQSEEGHEEDDERRLGLVFFDIMMLDSKSMLREPYWKRRQMLEKVIMVVPGASILAFRTPITMKDGLNEACTQLQHVFAQAIARFEEGLVLKEDASPYDDRRSPWVKLKKDYIPGLGDTLDLAIIGAGWDRDRGRKLRVPVDTLTTFYFGTLNQEKSSKEKPHFDVYSTSKFIIGREKLEELNFIVKNADPLVTLPARGTETANRIDHPFTYALLPGLKVPTCILRQPLLAEVFGGGFDKPEGTTHFHLRWPRMSKWYRPADRDWRNCCTTSTIDQLGRKSQGLDRADKDLDDALNLLWDKPISQSIRALNLQGAETEEWKIRLALADGTTSTKKRKSEDDVRPAIVSRFSSDTIKRSQPKRLPSDIEANTPSKGSRVRSRSHVVAASGRSPVATDVGVSAGNVWSDCLVWIAREREGVSQLDAWSNIIPSQNQVHTLQALWQGCRSDDSVSGGCRVAWYSRGLVILNADSAEGTRVMESLRIWANAAGLFTKPRCAFKPAPGIPIWVIDTIRAQEPRLITDVDNLRGNVSGPPRTHQEV